MLEEWEGEPLVRRAGRALVAARLQPAIVVASPDPAVRRVLEDLLVTVVVNAEPERGLSSSVRVGLAALPRTVDAVVMAVADQPNLNADQLGRLVGAYQEGQIVVSRYGDRTGTPSIYPRRFFQELKELTGDQGGRAVADRHPDEVIEVEFEARAGEDIDTPGDWERLRRSP